MSWEKIEDHLFNKYDVEGEDKELSELMEEHDKEIRAEAIDEFLHNAETKICDRILQNQARLDFASGLSVANRILDEVAEQMKAGGKNENNN